jgi:predicted  nucleic acid-binding Zn-ribbon protein
MTQAEALYRLQEIELGILHCQKRLAEIAAALENNMVVTEAQSRVDAAQKTLRPLQTKMRDLELEIQSNLAKSKTTEQQLYSGSVKNPKALQEMEQEIVALKQWHGELENRLLEVMVAVEDAEAEFDNAQKSLEEVTVTWEREHQDLLQEKAQLEEKVSSLQIQRKEAAKQITPENLKTYSSMRARKNNQPMALLQGHSCAVCGIEQTSAIEQEVRRGHSLVTCLGCGRILVHLGS